MGVDPSGVLDKATWGIAGAIWRWLWFRQRLYSLLLLLVWSALFAMGGIFFGFQESDFPSFFLWVAGIMVLPCEVMARAYAWQKLIGRSFNGLTLALLKNEDSHPPVMVGPTWGVAIRIAWWQLWRWLVVLSVFFLIFLVLSKTIGVEGLVLMTLMPSSLFVSIYLYKKMIGQSFGGLRLVLCQPDEAS
ncbi:hypothetical protein EBZ35_05605 [bacterium]|nr:hypothetical protein [bacterium]